MYKKIFSNNNPWLCSDGPDISIYKSFFTSFCLSISPSVCLSIYLDFRFDDSDDDEHYEDVKEEEEEKEEKEEEEDIKDEEEEEKEVTEVKQEDEKVIFLTFRATLLIYLFNNTYK